MKKLKKLIYNIIRDDKQRIVWNKVFHAVIIALIIISITLVILDTINLSVKVMSILHIVSLLTVSCFILEYLLRFWTADFLYHGISKSKARLKYVLSFMAVIDFLALLPFFIPLIFSVSPSVMRMIGLLKLLRLFKFNKYTHAMSNIGTVIKNKGVQLLSSIFVIFVLMISSSVVMFYLESNAQPEIFRDAFSGFWWYINTVTTVGYGDIYPITSGGKLVSGIISLLGIGLVAVPTGIISAGFIEIDEEEYRIHDVSHLRDQLLILKKLQDEGLLTQDEFNNQKRQLLKK